MPSTIACKHLQVGHAEESLPSEGAPPIPSPCGPAFPCKPLADKGVLKTHNDTSHIALYSIVFGITLDLEMIG